MVDLVVLAALVDSVASFLQTWSGRAITFVAGLGILGIIFRKFVTRVFDSVMGELVRLSDGIPYLHPFLKWLHPQPIEEVADSQEETKEVVDEIHEEVVTTPVERLENQGLKRLTEENFDPGKRDPEACWRRPFEFAEIRANFAIHRQRTDDERTDVTEDLLGKLRGEEVQSQIVVGPPGSGKTTVCKTVATEWYEADELGPVFYRESGATHSITDPGDVVDGLSELSENEAEGRILVVVEDAVRAGTVRIHKAIDDCPSDLDVSFLLDAREHEWDDFGEFVRTHLEMGTAWNRILDNRTENVRRYQIPTLDPEEVRRVVEKFAEVTDSSEDRLPSPENLHEQIRGDVDLEGGRSAGPSPMLLLTYHFPVGGIDISGQDEDKSALRIHVEEVYSEVSSGAGDSTAGSGLLDDVALLVNVLNAADIGVHEELVQTVADDDDERGQVGEHLRDDLAGLLTYGEREGKQFWSNHELWSQVYLDHFLEKVGDDAARNRFGQVVSEYLSIVDGEDANPELWRWYQGDTELLREIEERPTEKADEYVSGVFEMGVQRPGLVTLLGRTNDHDPIEVPAACSRVVRANRPIWRGQAYLRHGDYGKAEAEYETALRVADDLGIDEKRSRAPILNNLGIVATQQSDYQAAREYYERSLAIKRDFDDRVSEARTLGNLGNIARRQSDYQAAREYYERSLAIFEDFGDRVGEARTFANLGNVAQQQGAYDDAREYYERSLAIFEDLGDRTGEATTLNNLGIVARLQSDYEAARDHYERSLAITRDLGDRAGEARTLNNLGIIAHQQGDYAAARDYYERSLAIHREVDDRASEASNLNELGSLARSEGEYETARERHQEALQIRRDIGDSAGVATSLNNLGNVAAQQSDYNAARDYYEEAEDIFRDIGAIRQLLQTHHNLALVCEQQNNLETAIEWCETGISTIDQADISGLEDERETFGALLNQLRTQGPSIDELYTEAFENVLDNEGGTALQFFRHAWEQRDEASEDQHPTALSTGVGVAAHVELFDDQGADEEKREILEEIEPDRDQLPDPVDAVFEYLAEGEVNATPEELLESTVPELEDADEISPEDLERDELETLAFARLLEVLTDSGPEPPEGMATGYAQALQHILGNETQEAMQTLYAVWNQRDSIDKDADEFSPVLAAAVGFAAYLCFVDDEEAEEERKAILGDVARHEDRLAQPERALYEYLTEGETDTTPEGLRDQVDEDSEEPDINDMEYIAYAGLLEALQEQAEQ